MVKVVFCLDMIPIIFFSTHLLPFVTLNVTIPEKHLTLAPNARKFLVTGLQMLSDVTTLALPSGL